MPYDENKFVTLKGLKTLGLKVREKTDQLGSEITAVSKQVSMAANYTDEVLDSMYQKPTHTQYVTKGNFSSDETGDILSKTLSELLGDDLPEDLSLIVNGVTVGVCSGTTILSDVLNAINGNQSDGVTVSYSPDSGDFTFTATKVGPTAHVRMGEGLAYALFGPPAVEEPLFKDAYGVPWLGDTQKINIHFGYGILTISGSGTISDVCANLNKTIHNMHLTAAYDPYTGKLQITNENGAPREFRIWLEDEDLGDVDFEFQSEYAPAGISYTVGADGVFTAVKVNNDIQKVTDKTVTISVPTKTSQLTNDATFQTKTEVETIAAAAVASSSKAVFEKVNSIPDAADAEDNVLYLVMNDLTGHYDIYAKVNDDVVLLDDTTVDLSNYVEKEEGMGLSSNDFTTEDKEKLESIATGATKVEATAGSGTLTIDGESVTLFEVSTDAETAEMLNEVFGVSDI